jgi:hypothetical protein
MAMGMVGMFVGSVIASGAGPDLVKPAIAGVVCCGLPFLGVCLMVRMLKSR